MNNNLFQLGNFDGYQVKGRCKIVTDYKHPLEDFSHRFKKPGFGKFMALLDDPSLINEPDGTRIADAQVPDDYFEKAAFDFTQSNSSGKKEPTYVFDLPDALKTASNDGAYLELSEQLHIGTEVRIRWDFLITEAGDNNFALNDFALVDIVDSATHKTIHREILQQTVDIPAGRWSTGWRHFTWRSPVQTKATIRIAVCNGYLFSETIPSHSSQQNAARSFPSGLLVDCINVA